MNLLRFRQAAPMATAFFLIPASFAQEPGGDKVDLDVLAQVKTEELLAVNLTPGSRAPATCTAMGKAMLAADFREVRAIVGPGPYPRRTEHSITTYDELASELTEIQRLGYAVDRQELNLGVWCVAAPILGVRQTQPAAVSVSAYAPTSTRPRRNASASWSSPPPAASPTASAASATWSSGNPPAPRTPS